jgi:hypothetical protein
MVAAVSPRRCIMSVTKASVALPLSGRIKASGRRSVLEIATASGLVEENEVAGLIGLAIVCSDGHSRAHRF